MGLKEEYRQGKHQGREFTTTIQANSKAELDEMIDGLKEYARSHRMDSPRVLLKDRDPDGGYKAIVVAHNWNPIGWIKEKLEERREEKEYKKRRERGEVPPEELSPREQREEVGRVRRRQEAAAEEAQRARKELREEEPRVAREAIRAKTEAERAEARAKILETKLHGAPYKVPPEEIIRDRWGKEVSRRPVTGKRREELARLELAQLEGTKIGTEIGLTNLQELRRLQREAISRRKRERFLSPARTVAKGVAGTVAGVGRAVGGVGVRTGPYAVGRIRTELFTPRLRRPIRPTEEPQEPTAPRQQPPSGMGLSHLRNLQLGGMPKIPLFPTSRPPSGRREGGKKKKNTYNSNLKRMRRLLF